MDEITDGGIANFDVGLEFVFKQFEKVCWLYCVSEILSVVRPLDPSLFPQFDLLKSSHEGAECHKLIMLFTDGGMQKPNKTLIKYNRGSQVRGRLFIDKLLLRFKYSK